MASPNSAREQKGKHLWLFTEFATKANEQVLMKAGISFTDVAHAKMNLEREITGWDFDKVHTRMPGHYGTRR